MRRADEAPEPSIDVDVDAKYIVELTDLSEAPSQWSDAKEGDVSLTWKFRLYDQQTGVAVIDNNNGFAYELWQFSNDKTYRNVKSGKAAKAREWAEALIGQGELSDDQVNDLIDNGFGEVLKGKRALADIEWYTTAKGFERLKIIRLRPLKTQKQAKAEYMENGASPRLAAAYARSDVVHGEAIREPAPATKEAARVARDEVDAQEEAKAAARKLLGLDAAA